MKPGRTVLAYLLTGLTVLGTTAAAGLLTGNPLTSALVAVAWAGVLGRRHVRSLEDDSADSHRAENDSGRYRQR